MMDIKDQARLLLLNTLKQVDIQSLIKQSVQLVETTLLFNGEAIDLANHDEILLIGFGKASLEMGEAVESILVDKLTRGLLVSNHRKPISFRSEIIVSGHPTPNANSILAAENIISAIENSTARSLIIFLVSGGGSSMVELPIGSITLEELQQLNKTLVECGATIQEINAVRKQLSQIKGGKLGRLTGKRKCLAIYLSDVNEGDLGSLASGPLIEQEADPEHFQSILERYGLLEKLPATLSTLIQEEQKKINNRKSSAPSQNISHLLLLDNNGLLKIASRQALASGFRVSVCTDLVEGNYRLVADSLLARLKSLQNQFPQDSVCLLSGGEVECPVKSNGLGGRNQEFVIYSATRSTESDRDFEIAILSCGSDGIDGSSCAAGAVLSSDDVTDCSGIGLDATSFINQNDSYSFLKQSGGLFVLGPTGNNVRDLRILLSRPKTKKEKNHE
jgi:glycerate-2-kinase